MSFLLCKGYFCSVEQKLIYIPYLDNHVNTCYTVTDEKVSGSYTFPRNDNGSF